MMELTVNVNINAPEVCAAMLSLAKAVSTRTPKGTVAPEETSKVIQMPQTQATPPAEVQTVPAPQPQIPTSVAGQQPSITLDALSRAGAALATAGRMAELMALMQKYGVQAITQLPPDKYDAVAADLRAMGAQI